MMTAEAKAAWLADRCGRLTASRMADAMAYLKSGQSAMPRMRLMRELLAERVTGLSVPHVVTDAMTWGLETEDEAADYFVERFPMYNPVVSRFYLHPTIENFGATPDREIDDDGLLEIKCPVTATFLEWSLAGVVPEQHKPQMCAQILCTGRKWVGFVAYDPRIKDPKRRLFLRKYEPSADELKQVEDAAVKFLDELDAMFSQFVECAA